MPIPATRGIGCTSAPRSLLPSAILPPMFRRSCSLTGNSVGQIVVFVNGVETGRTKGMAEHPGGVSVAAFRRLALHAGCLRRPGAGHPYLGRPTVKVHRGLLVKAEVGTQPEIADKLAEASGVQWNEHATASIVVAFLFLCVAALGAALYLAQRNHSEYLWLALLCIAIAASGTADACFGLSLLPLPVYHILVVFIGRIFMAVTLEFVLRFTASPYRKLVRGVQIAVLILPFPRAHAF